MNVYLMRRTMLKIEQLSLLATVVIAFSALAALVLTGQAGIRQELRAVQTDLLAGQAELRRETRTVETKLREEIRAVEAKIREEIRGVEAELRTGQAELREDLGAVGVRLTVVEHRTEALDPRFAAGAAARAQVAGHHRYGLRRVRSNRTADRTVPAFAVDALPVTPMTA